MTDEHDILIEADGTIRYVYSDILADVFAGEGLTTRRASHVEPGPLGGWVADMSPSDGPFVGARGTGVSSYEVAPFRTRQAALDAEREWLRLERGL